MAQVEPHESGSVPSDRTAADRGWSLDFARSGRLGGALSAVLLAASIIPATALAGGYDPGSDVNSMASTTAYTGAAALWDAGFTGDGRRRGGHRHGCQPGGRPGHAGQGHLRTRPLARVPGARPAQPRHQRPRNVHGRTHRRQGRRPLGAVLGCAGFGLSRDGPGRPDRVGEGRRRGRWGGRQPGHRGDRLGRPASQRQRPEHPDHQPVVRDQQRSAVHDRPARLRGRAGLEGGHLRRRSGRQLRLPEPHEQRPGAGRPGHRSLRHGRRVVGLRGNDDDRRTTRCRPSRRGRSVARRAAST